MSVTIQTDTDVLAALKEFRQRRGAEFRLLALGVFGSFARGEATAQSDVDVVYETDEPNLFRAAQMKDELAEALGRHVDVVRLRGGMNHRLRARIEREAKYV